MKMKLALMAAILFLTALISSAQADYYVYDDHTPEISAHFLKYDPNFPVKIVSTNSSGSVVCLSLGNAASLGKPVPLMTFSAATKKSKLAEINYTFLSAGVIGERCVTLTDLTTVYTFGNATTEWEYNETGMEATCSGSWETSDGCGGCGLSCECLYDGSWTTCRQTESAFPGTTGEFYINYTVPIVDDDYQLDLNGTKWLVKCGSPHNITLFNNCSVAGTNKLQLWVTVGAASGGTNIYHCINSTGQWSNISTESGATLYEESLTWHFVHSQTWYDNNLLTNCSEDGTTGKTQALIFHYLMESNKTSVNGSMEIYFEVLNAAGNQKNNYSFSFSTANTTHAVCMYPSNATYYADAQLQFDGTGYSPRSYYLTNATLTNVTQDINLYLLEDSSSAGVLVYVKDSSDNYVAGSKVILEKYYIGSGTYETVVIGETDGSGKFYTYLDLNDVYYRAYVYDTDGTLSNEYEPFTVADTTNDPEELVFYLSSAPPEYFDFEGSAAYYCTFTNATKIIRCVITDGSGLMSQACLNVDKQGLVSYTDICDTCGTGSSVTLTCNITNYANGTILYKFSADMSSGNSKMLVMDYVYFPGAPKFGDTGIIATIIMIIGMGLVGIFSPMVAMFLAIAGLAIGVGLGMVEVSVTSLLGLIVLVIIIAMGGRRNS